MRVTSQPERCNKIAFRYFTPHIRLCAHLSVGLNLSSCDRKLMLTLPSAMTRWSLSSKCALQIIMMLMMCCFGPQMMSPNGWSIEHQAFSAIFTLRIKTHIFLNYKLIISTSFESIKYLDWKMHNYVPLQKFQPLRWDTPLSWRANIEILTVNSTMMLSNLKH